MRVVIVGAGPTGLVNARTLVPLGVDVAVYEARADVGGVWSGTRGYPGQRLQSDKRFYAFSDAPMPDDYPSLPDRAQVQAYLAEYARTHGILDRVRLSTRVVFARFDPERQEWALTAEGPAGVIEDRADWLIIANGTLSTPARPILSGEQAFTATGGRVVDACALGDAPGFEGARVVVLGYGKSGADIAVAASAAGARTVDVIARSAPWKLPQRIAGVPFERILLSRLGDHLLWGSYATLRGRVLRRATTIPRLAFRALLRRRIRAQLQLDRRNTVPDSTILHVSHTVTPGFDRAVDAGQVHLHVGAVIEDLLGGPDGPAIRLRDETVLPADLLVAATGYRTDLSFLDDRVRSLLLEEDGRPHLYAHTLATAVPRLVLAGWINSFRSPIAAEVQALWIAAMLHGEVPLARSGSDGRPWRVLAAHPRETDAPRGLSIADQDDLLRQAGLRLPKRVRREEWLRSIDPSSYAGLHEQLRARLVGLAPHRAQGDVPRTGAVSEPS